MNILCLHVCWTAMYKQDKMQSEIMICQKLQMFLKYLGYLKDWRVNMHKFNKSQHIPPSATQAHVFIVCLYCIILLLYFYNIK